jgi:hypothetical protein
MDRGRVVHDKGAQGRKGIRNPLSSKANVAQSN